MAEIILAVGGGGAAGSDECTATRNQVLKGYTAIVKGSDDEPIEGTIPTKTNSGNVLLTASYTSVSYDGNSYFPNAHGAYVNVFSW